MITLNLASFAGRTLRVLCLGAHSDDIEIGCGGTILKLRGQYPDCSIDWVVFSAIGVREAEARRGAELFAGPEKGKLLLKNFRDGYMPYEGAGIKDLFEAMKDDSPPDLIFTHNSTDAHQDHRLIAELTWNTFRNHLILEYEIPKYDGDMGRPNVYVPLETEIYQAKLGFVQETFRSQSSKRWFEESTFLSLMRLRGMECNAPSGYAEAFYCRKLIL